MLKLVLALLQDTSKMALQEDEDIQRKRLLMQYAKFKGLASKLVLFA